MKSGIDRSQGKYIFEIITFWGEKAQLKQNNKMKVITVIVKRGILKMYLLHLKFCL